MEKLNIDIIKPMIDNGKIRWTNHVIIRLFQRNISQEDIKRALLNGEINEVEESNKMMLNGQIEGYKGTIKGLELKQLIRWINSSNENEIYPTKLVINDYSNSNIILDDEEYSIDGVKDSNKYEISLEYGENEIVTTVNVNMGE